MSGVGGPLLGYYTACLRYSGSAPRVLEGPQLLTGALTYNLWKLAMAQWHRLRAWLRMHV